ncbi:hypothetical protein [Sphingobium yanoikuyae]|uniref:hypothetical protein n=1 Tax=Sphingobium yanoikuyae TaxID=13690 RepID=UPI0035C71DA2
MLNNAELKDMHVAAVEHLEDVRAAMEARRVIDWLDAYMPPKDAPEDRFSVELHLDAGRTHGADEANRYLSLAIMSLAPKIVATAKEMAAQKIEKVS